MTVIKVAVYSADGAAGKEIELPEVFETKVNEHLIYEAVKCYLANQRQGTSKTKTRAEVSGGGIKPWRQKGTGRARSGSNTSPIWKRGGKAHGPKPRTYDTALNRMAKRSALRMALSIKAQNGGITVIDALAMNAPKTKDLCAILKNLGIEKAKSLVVVEKSDKNILLAARNVMNLRVKPVAELNVYEIMNCEKIVLTKQSLGKISEVFKA